MFKDLNDNIKRIIYEYDNTYKDIFNKCMLELKTTYLLRLFKLEMDYKGWIMLNCMSLTDIVKYYRKDLKTQHRGDRRQLSNRFIKEAIKKGRPYLIKYLDKDKLLKDEINNDFLYTRIYTDSNTEILRRNYKIYTNIKDIYGYREFNELLHQKYILSILNETHKDRTYKLLTQPPVITIT